MKAQIRNSKKTISAVLQIESPVLAMRDTLKFLPENAHLEWLETNGLGGFASSSINGMNTRRYHGLLTAALFPPDGRHVLLSKLEEDLIIGENRFYLATNQYGHAIYPEGYTYIQEFALDPFPVWTYKVEGIVLQKTLFMIHNQHTVCVEYKIIKQDNRYKEEKITLELRPLTAFRSYHQLTHENSSLNPDINMSKGFFTFKPYHDLPELFFTHNAFEVKGQGSWYKDFLYTIENQRGLEDREDLFNPCMMSFDLTESKGASLIASLELQDISNVDKFKKQEIRRRNNCLNTAPEDTDFSRCLSRAADQFIVGREGQKTVIAGYHWFADWGRDTMIALPGLTLTTGRFNDAQQILVAFSRYINQGMLPNRFGEGAQAPEYNTVDAVFWYFEAIRQFGATTLEWKFIKDNFYNTLKDIVDWHIKGTRYNIHMDEDGLIYAGQEGVQLTWMDAKVGNWVVTPRIGKPVEIQALWYNALCIMKDLAERSGIQKDIVLFDQMALKAQESFNQYFWNEAQGGLFDVINGDVKDDAIRPNQIFALSLHYPILDKSKHLEVVSLVEKELLTPVGLRTLSQSHKDYKGIYQGGPTERDGAYHQGTVWPWLLGPFIRAYLKTKGRSESVLNQARAMIHPLELQLKNYGIGQIAEIYDGDYPHAPKGCIAQAWSVGQTLEIIKEIGNG